MVVVNVSVFLKSFGSYCRSNFSDNHNIKIKNSIEGVGVSYARESKNKLTKMGDIMSYTESLSLQLPQHKLIIIFG